MNLYIGELISWVNGHPDLAGFVVSSVAFLESLAFVGLFVPGAILMVGFGALIAVGALPFWTTLGWAISGAVLGDGISYFIGAHFHERIFGFWPFNRHPELISRGQAFIRKHGGKSVFLGRFAGPVRPLIPIVSGMLQISAARFLLLNFLSALISVPAYLLPGIAIGMSLAMASEVAVKFALLLALVIIFFWLSFRIPLFIYRIFKLHAKSWMTKLINWGRRHSFLGWLINGLIDPLRPASPALLVSAAFLIGSVWLFLDISEDVLTQDPLLTASHNIYQLLQSLRTPWGDRIMVAFTELGDAVVTITVTLAVSIWLIWRRAWHSMGYLIAAMIFGSLVVTIMKVTFQVPRPAALYTGISSYSFPSGHATMSMVLFGFLAFLVSRGLASIWRWVPFGVAGILISIIGISRLYLGAHWMYDVAGGFSLGLAWLIILSIAYTRHGLPRRPLTGLSMVVLVVLFLAGGWHIRTNLPSDIEMYASKRNVKSLDVESWWNESWRALPENRHDLEGEKQLALNVQYAGELRALKSSFILQGWQEPVPLDKTSFLRWFLSSPRPVNLPILPKIHDGLNEALLLIRPFRGNPDKLLALRLWRSNIKLGSEIPLWIGTITMMEKREYFHLMTFLRTEKEISPEQTLSHKILEPFRWKIVRREDGVRVLLFHMI